MNILSNKMATYLQPREGWERGIIYYFDDIRGFIVIQNISDWL